MVPPLIPEKIKSYRAATYRLPPHAPVGTQEDAIDFVEERGFVFFWPIQAVLLPNLWSAVAGDRPVANDHDDPGHVTWGWKDSMLGKRVWYYAKVLRKRATLISLEAVPYFYALSENYGTHEEDYLLQYEQGRLSHEAKSIYESLLESGPLDTVALRNGARMTGRSADYRFQKALSELQADFKILPVGVAKAGAWRYAFVYDLVPRHFPDLPEQARWIPEDQAREELLLRYLRSVGAARWRDVLKVFGWSKAETQPAVEAASERGLLLTGLRLADDPGEWIALSTEDLISSP